MNTIDTEKRISRRDFLKLGAAAGAGLLTAAWADRMSRVGELQTAGETRGELPLDLPKGTYLTADSAWFLQLKGVPADVLEKYNGPKNAWDMPEMGGVFLIPSSYVDNKEGADAGAKDKLRSGLVFRVDVERDVKADAGWEDQELKSVQSLLPLMIRRNKEFFGRPRWRGFVKVSRPNKEAREKIKNEFPDFVAGAVMGSRTTPGALEMVILTNLAEFSAQFPGTNPDTLTPMYSNGLKDLLAHEIGHIFLLGMKLGSRLDNHAIVRTLGASAVLVELLGKTWEEILKFGGYPDMEKPEMLLWKAFKVKGREFYAELIGGLVKKYGEKMEFTDKQVEETANDLFEQVGFSFSFNELVGAIGKEPDESGVATRSMEGYRYPIERVAGDKYNPDGMVSWWVEVKSLAPVQGGTRGWAAQAEPFPDQDGFYKNFKFIGNGGLKDGPPDGNSLAIAAWMKGGSLTGSEVMFPISVYGIEQLRAVKIS